MEPECVGCSVAPAVTSGYCQTCSDTAEAWSEARAERLERATQALRLMERRAQTATTPPGLGMFQESHVRIWPAPGFNPAESNAAWDFVSHRTSLDPMTGIMAQRRKRGG